MMVGGSGSSALIGERERERGIAVRPPRRRIRLCFSITPPPEGNISPSRHRKSTGQNILPLSFPLAPSRFGPICCLVLLTGATSYYAPKASLIGPFSALTCLLFYAVAVASLFAVSCMDPGVVRAGRLDAGGGGGGRHGYSGLPTTSMTAGRGWRFCDLCR